MGRDIRRYPSWVEGHDDPIGVLIGRFRDEIVQSRLVISSRTGPLISSRHSLIAEPHDLVIGCDVVHCEIGVELMTGIEL